MQIGKNQQRHHWLFQQGQGWGKNVPNSIKNQPWNINPVSSSLNNWMSRGNSNVRSLIGSPSWAQQVAAGSAIAGGSAAAGNGGGSCGCP